jgi:hypothetical protein
MASPKAAPQKSVLVPGAGFLYANRVQGGLATTVPHCGTRYPLQEPFRHRSSHVIKDVPPFAHYRPAA